MESLTRFSPDWLKTVCVLSAFLWVAYRAYQVIFKPVEELIALLGLEVPVAPLVSLGDIKCDGVLLRWKPLEPRTSIVKYVIRINGVDIGQVPPQETSITVENLQPDHQYVVRVVTVNSANFQAPSEPIRVRTLPPCKDEYYNPTPQADAFEPTDDDEYTPTPIIRPNKSLADVVTSSPAAPVTREHSNSVSRVRRTEIARRNSPASQTVDQARAAQELDDSPENIRVLTEKLDGLRRELEDVERQIKEEEAEFQAQKASLAEKRDEKRSALKDKEDTSHDLRKKVASLERANVAAQAKRSQQERLLRQKEADRNKLKEDVARWIREAEELRVIAENLEKERVELKAEGEIQIQKLKDKHGQEMQVNKAIEEAIRDKGTQIKALEQEREHEEGEAGFDAQEGVEVDAEEDRQWTAKYNALQQSYAQAWSVMSQAERDNTAAASRLQYLQQRRLSQPQLFASAPSLEAPPRRRNSQVSRPVSIREPYGSAAPGGFVLSNAPTFNSSVTSASPPYPNATPYFNINNGMALPPPNGLTSPSFSHHDFDGLTGGGPMSPTAGALLPSGLLGDDSGLTDAEDENDPGPPQPSMDPSPHLRHILPGLGAPGTLDKVHNPSSPASNPSRSPSLFASPRESASQLGYFPASDNMVDSDKRSIRSASSSVKHKQPSRFQNVFSRQRGKTLSDQGLPLGSLKPTQSQSLPRQDHAGPDPIGTRRRRGSHSEGAWYNNLLRGSRPAPAESSESPKHVATRKRPFAMFGSRGADPWLPSNLSAEDRPSSPRPGSTKSIEFNALPRPSTDSHTRFGWPGSGDGIGGARSSALGLVDWSNNATAWGSRLPSRRPSLQHGSTVDLVHDELFHGDLPDFPSTTRSPAQAPIGTRPQSSASHMPVGAPVPPTPPKALNPAAPTFEIKNLFARGEKSEEDKAQKAKKAAEKAAEKNAEKAEKEAKKAEKVAERKASKAEKSDKALRKEKERQWQEMAGEHGSFSYPLDPRRSRDARSVSTVDISEASPRASLEKTVSMTSSDAHAACKETFMQKLSRKSSSSQFLQFGKAKSNLFLKKSNEPSTPPVDHEHDGFLNVVRSVDSSTTNSPSVGTPKDKSSGLSWSSIKRMGKRGDKTPSLHESIASETTEDEEDGDGFKS
ncbi:hypothetical protein M011DRAFT_394853 [Sporormia fimetaria CBS 119925]|uniref:Fibronectin type-III domain-containing protein n=1 Tax=Sporormia fimetaria CBS 119925 TaxID=1340428 RepID=A0A6A6VLX2_9PLEO|nr:hypothetical protein M011DRAFT_394853 [Sporormia fimetaria CBS 119925]